MSRFWDAAFWVGLFLLLAVVVLCAVLSAPQHCTGGGKGTGEPVRCAP